MIYWPGGAAIYGWQLLAEGTYDLLPVAPGSPSGGVQRGPTPGGTGASAGARS
jgi:hypothetical protein